jgi:hypothetical protein
MNGPAFDQSVNGLRLGGLHDNALHGCIHDKPKTAAHIDRVLQCPDQRVVCTERF